VRAPKKFCPGGRKLWRAKELILTEKMLNNQCFLNIQNNELHGKGKASRKRERKTFFDAVAAMRKKKNWKQKEKKKGGSRRHSRKSDEGWGGGRSLPKFHSALVGGREERKREISEIKEITRGEKRGTLFWGGR